MSNFLLFSCRWKSFWLPATNKISPDSAGFPQDRGFFLFGLQFRYFYPLYRGIDAGLQHPHKFLRRHTVFFGKPPHKGGNECICIKIDAELLAQVTEVLKSYGLTPEEAAVQFFKYCADPKTQDHAIKLLKRWKEEQEVQERNSANAK